MMRSIIRSSLQFRYLVVVVAGVLMLSGINQIRKMPLDVLPEFSPPFVEIQTEALGLSAEEVEQMITVPMEQDLLAGVAWLDIIRSESVPGLSSVLIYFEPGTDLYRARQMVSERLAQAAVGIPHVSKPPAMIQPTSSASRFLIVGLSSKKLSLIDVGVLTRWTIAPRLLGVPGVANVSIWGSRDRQLQVLVDPQKLQEQGVSLGQVIETTGNALWVSSLSFLEASSPGTGGFIDTPNQRLGIWHVLPISSPDDLSQVPVEGTPLILSDVAEVVEDHQPLIGDAVVNDSSSLLLVIEKLPGANTLDVTKGVEAALAALKPGFADIEFDATLFRPASFIEMVIANLTRTLVISALLAVLFLGLFFYGWRAALITFAALLLSLVTALYVLHLRGETLNAMVLAGLTLALGLIIDDVVVDVDQLLRRLRQNKMEGGLKSAETIILEAAAEMRGLLFFAALITLLAIVPVFFMDGISGAVFHPMAISFVLAVLASMAAALTVTPVLSLFLLPNTRLEDSPLARRLGGGYERFLAKTIHNPRLVYMTVVILFIAGLIVVPALRQKQSLPLFREPYIMIEVDGAPSTSQPEMNRIMARMSSELRTVPGVNNVGVHVGRAVLGDQVVGINSAEIWVSINPAGNYDAAVSAIQEIVNGYPGLELTVGTYLSETLRPSKISTSDPFTVRVYGEEHQALVSEAEKVRQVLAGISGVVDSHVLLPIEEPTVEIKVDLDKAREYGIKPGEVRRAAATLLSGLQVGSLFEEQKVFDVVVWGRPETRRDLTDIRQLLIDTPGGGHVQLGDVADVSITSAPTVILREAISPYIDIGFDIRGRNIEAVLGDAKIAMQDYPFPLEYHAEVQNDYATQRAARQNIITSTLLAAAGIFLLLQASSASWRLALVAFLTLPVGLAGGLLTAYLGGGAISIAALFGLLAVLGIGARNIILLIHRYQSLEKAGSSFGPALILRGSRERLAPILITALTVTLILLPFVVFGNIPGHEILYPMAVVMLGGLTSTLFLNLFFLPVMYLHFGAVREPDLELAEMEAQPAMTGHD
ncbi:MAG: efflux RND transporter permease subunit [Chloroflexi bacterium]|nr:efflux RND transporter permease subunit [Chloroflexota bacterium]